MGHLPLSSYVQDTSLPTSIKVKTWHFPCHSEKSKAMPDMKWQETVIWRLLWPHSFIWDLVLDSLLWTTHKEQFFWETDEPILTTHDCNRIQRFLCSSEFCLDLNNTKAHIKHKNKAEYYMKQTLLLLIAWEDQNEVNICCHDINHTSWCAPVREESRLILVWVLSFTHGKG